MATEISVKSGSTGSVQDVTSAKRAAVVGYVSSTAYAAVVDYQEGYVAQISKTPTGADDEFFYLHNAASTKLIIDRIVLTDAAAETVKLYYCTGTAAGGTTLVPVNLYSGSAHTFALMSASNICESGVDITGLTPVSTLDTFVQGVGTVIDHNYAANNGLPVVVPPGTAVCLSAVTGTSAIVGQVYFHYAMEPMTA